jgi:hypothetical protein
MTSNLFPVRAARWVAACALAGACAAESRAERKEGGSALADIVTVAVRSRPELIENSAAVMSEQYPGVLYSINDSGNEPLLFALDTTGHDRGVWRVAGARDIDWESASMGPCANDPAPRCLYIGDTGDNTSTHPSRVIYRVSEPAPKDSAFTGSLTPDSVAYVYPDGRHDVEAMYVAPNGDMYLITKRALRTRLGSLRAALLFRIPVTAWTCL